MPWVRKEVVEKMRSLDSGHFEDRDDMLLTDLGVRHREVSRLTSGQNRKLKTERRSKPSMGKIKR